MNMFTHSRSAKTPFSIASLLFLVLTGMLLTTVSCKKSESLAASKSVVGTYQGVNSWWQKGDAYAIDDSTAQAKIDSNNNSITVTYYTNALIPPNKVFKLPLTQKNTNNGYTLYTYSTATYDSTSIFKGHSFTVFVGVWANSAKKNYLSITYDTSYDGGTVGNTHAVLYKK